MLFTFLKTSGVYLLNRFLGLFLALTLTIPATGQNVDRALFSAPGIPIVVAQELEAMFENFLVQYNSAGPDEQAKLAQDFFNKLDLFAYQLLQANRKSVGQRPGGQQSHQQIQIRRFEAFQQMNVAIQSDNPIAAEKALAVFQNPEVDHGEVLEEKIEERAELQMSAEALTATLRALRLALQKTDRKVGKLILAKAVNFKLSDLKKLENEIRQASKTDTEDEGVLAIELIKMAEVKARKPKPKKNRLEEMEPEKGLLATVVGALGQQIQNWEEASRQRAIRIQKWSSARREKKIERQKEAKALRESYLVTMANEKRRREGDSATASYGSSRADWTPPSALKTVGEMVAIVVSLPLAGAGIVSLAELIMPPHEILLPSVLLGAAVTGVFSLAFSIPLCASLLSEYKSGQKELESRRRGY